MSQNMRCLPEWSEDVGILKDNYGYDKNANVTSIADWREGISNRGLTYDGLNRLMQVNAPSLWGDAFYTYDAQDNLTSARVTAGGTARTTTHKINPATNLLDSITNSAGSSYNFVFGYDSQGNIIKRGAQSYAFDLANRMTGATGKATYAYDGLGHRISVVGADELPNNLPDYLAQVERDIILRALNQTQFNRTQAATLLGISVRQLRYQMQKLDIQAPEP